MLPLFASWRRRGDFSWLSCGFFDFLFQRDKISYWMISGSQREEPCEFITNATHLWKIRAIPSQPLQAAPSISWIQPMFHIFLIPTLMRLLKHQLYTNNSFHFSVRPEFSVEDFRIFLFWFDSFLTSATFEWRICFLDLLDVNVFKSFEPSRLRFFVAIQRRPSFGRIEPCNDSARLNHAFFWENFTLHPVFLMQQVRSEAPQTVVCRAQAYPYWAQISNFIEVWYSMMTCY